MPNPMTDFMDEAEAAPDDASDVEDLEERRLHILAYELWASLLDGREFPSLVDFTSEAIAFFRDQSFLIDFSQGYATPEIRFIGVDLQAQSDARLTGRPLADAPRQSLIGRLGTHHMEVLANRSPIGFEAEFETAEDENTLYRGILLPLSDDNEHVHFILGVANWKSERLGGRADEPAEDEPAIVLVEDVADDELGLDPVPMDLAEQVVWTQRQVSAMLALGSANRAALYDALGLVFGLYHALEADLDSYREILAQAGITRQVRAPFTPVLKLVFGVDYDKTRLTEYAAALAYARAEGETPETVARFIAGQEGGIKGCVRSERENRRARSGQSQASQLADAIDRLMRLNAIDLTTVNVTEDGDFALLLARRRADGGVEPIRVLPERRSAIEAAIRRAARALDLDGA